VGTGSVVGAGAVVSKPVVPYDIVAGVPARRLRSRFAPHVVEALLAIAWWDWDRETLCRRFKDLLDIDQFIARYADVAN
jgi:hypothetical protein